MDLTEGLKNIELFLIDLDGTVYLNNKLIDGSADAINLIRNNGKRVCFLTNNSSKSQIDYVEKLNNLGIPCTIDEVYTSGNSCVSFLQQHYPNKSVYLLGTEKLIKQFSDNSIKLTNAKTNSKTTNASDVVVIGYDTTLTYEKLVIAIKLISKGADYIVTHADINCPDIDVYVPDVGSFIKLIEASTGKLPLFNCGKPYEIMGKNIANKFNTRPSKIAMIGDRLTTDMQFAINNGFISMLVLSGETTMQMYEQSKLEISYVINSLADISKYI